jgi:hypothetical protein
MTNGQSNQFLRMFHRQRLGEMSYYKLAVHFMFAPIGSAISLLTILEAGSKMHILLYVLICLLNGLMVIYGLLVCKKQTKIVWKIITIFCEVLVALGTALLLWFSIIRCFFR